MLTTAAKNFGSLEFLNAIHKKTFLLASLLFPSSYKQVGEAVDNTNTVLVINTTQGIFSSYTLTMSESLYWATSGPLIGLELFIAKFDLVLSV